MEKENKKYILVVDFGGQTAHLISRRLKDLGVFSRLISPKDAYALIKKENPTGVILSGGPASVYEEKAPRIQREIFTLPVPMLDICYGLQLRSHLLGGRVKSGTKEYGPTQLTMHLNHSAITKGLPKKFTVWMSHGDSVLAVPKGFRTLGSSSSVQYAFISDEKNKHYGVQFHPEIEHTQNGMKILDNFLTICGAKREKQNVHVGELIASIRREVGDSYVIGAVSGGVDSTVAGVLTARAIGKRFIPIYVNNGLMRDGAEDIFEKVLKPYKVNPIVVDVRGEMLKKLRHVTDSEKKRKVIGAFYIEVFEREMEKLLKKKKNIQFLMQGTIFSDVIESKGSQHADKIKSHHNVGGLPKKMKLQLLEPLRNFYKDEVRALGKKLDIVDEAVWKQVFPGPGFAVRIRGEVTLKRLEQAKKADTILLEELQKTPYFRKIHMSFPVMTGAFSTAVKGDGRAFSEVVALRIIESADIMSTVWSRLPYDLLQKISSRIVNEVPDISRVVYDITTKPPATMEWE